MNSDWMRMISKDGFTVKRFGFYIKLNEVYIHKKNYYFQLWLVVKVIHYYEIFICLLNHWRNLMIILKKLLSEYINPRPNVASELGSFKFKERWQGNESYSIYYSFKKKVRILWFWPIFGWRIRDKLIWTKILRSGYFLRSLWTLKYEWNRVSQRKQLPMM